MSQSLELISDYYSELTSQDFTKLVLCRRQCLIVEFSYFAKIWDLFYFIFTVFRIFLTQNIILNGPSPLIMNYEKIKLKRKLIPLDQNMNI